MLTKTGALNDRQSLFVSRITRGIEHVTALVDNLLDLSTIELGVDPNLMPVDINQLAAEVVGDFQGKAQRSQQRLVFHPAAQPVLVTGNSLRLKQVVSNLVENALKYTLDSGQISALLQTKGNQAILKVEDTGIGILPADMPFVFDKFFRAKPAVQNGSSSGTGLGLAICKSIIEKYGGHIWVESQPQQGSTFIVALPLADQPLPVPMSTKTSSTA
jgi:signal transduction histidine kinase